MVVGALLVVLVGCGVSLYVIVSQPQWFERLRYPLHYSQYVRVHAREQPRPSAARGRDLPGIEFDAGAGSRPRGDRPDYSDACHGARIAIEPAARASTRVILTRRSTFATARGTSPTSSASTATNGLLAAYSGAGNVDKWRAAGQRSSFRRHARMPRGWASETRVQRRVALGALQLTVIRPAVCRHFDRIVAVFEPSFATLDFLPLLHTHEEHLILRPSHCRG